MNVVLKKNDMVGVVVPSRFIYGNSKNIYKGISLLKKKGFKVILSLNFKERFNSSAGNRFKRADSINKMFANPKVKAIFCAIGGDSANQILDLLNYDLIKKNPKPLIGYSDITHLILAIYTKTGIKTFHGPNLNSFFKLSKTSLKQMLSVLSNGKGFNYFSECRIWKPGKTEGELVGGNLMVINDLIKSDYIPKLDNAILFWEDINDGLSSIEYQLYQLYNFGVLAKIKGLIIGNIAKSNYKKNRLIKETILDLTKQYNYPILKTYCFGHDIKKFFTFPEGVKTKINTTEKTFVF